MALTAEQLRALVGILVPVLQDRESREHYWSLAFHNDPVHLAVSPDADHPEHYPRKVIERLDGEDRYHRTRSGRLSLLVYLEVVAAERQGAVAKDLYPFLAQLHSESAPVALASAVEAYLRDIVENDRRRDLMAYVPLRAQPRVAAAAARRPSTWDDFEPGYLGDRAGQRVGADGEPPEPVANVAERLATGLGDAEAWRAVLLGDPGMGKTWTLWTVLVLMAEAWLRATPQDREHVPIPILVPLRSYTGNVPTVGASDAPERAVTPFQAFVARRVPDDLRPHVDHLHVQQRLALLCDALNEMPLSTSDGRTLMLDVLDGLRDTQRFVVSCRRRDYRDALASLHPLEQIEILPLDPPAIHAAISARFEANDPESGKRLWEAIGGSDELLEFWNAVAERDEVATFWDRSANVPSYTSVEADEGWRQMFAGTQLVPVCRSPQLLELVCLEFAEHGTLTTNRHVLFTRFAMRLLERQARRDDSRSHAWPQDAIPNVVQALEATAFVLNAAAVTEMTEARLHEHATRLPPDFDVALTRAADAGLIELGGDVVAFKHQQFQEHCGCIRLLRLVTAGDDPALVNLANLPWWDPRGWSELPSVLADVRAAEEDLMPEPDAIARWLLPVFPELALSTFLALSEGDRPADVADDVHQDLVSVAWQSRDDADPAGRAAAYRVLGLLDADNRPGVGLDADGLPDVRRPEAWCEVPAGPFTMGADMYEWEEPVRTMELPRYWIARYPVTYAQYRSFLEAKDGYSSERWWREPLPIPRADEPGRQQWPITNHPAETVSWYDAVAYCRWLTARLGGVKDDNAAVVRLPSEAEWEKAARGPDGRMFPWGNAYEPGRANINETWDGIGPHRLSRTSAVGIYDQANVYGAMDLCGNVWEWTSTEHESREEAEPSSDRLRVVRGGSWDFGHGFARAAARFGLQPTDRGNDLGFRLVVSSPIW